MRQIKNTEKYAVMLSLALSACVTGYAQTLPADTAKREVKITYGQEENRLFFSPLAPPLQQVQGAPKAFYSFHWEFGDGQYSTEPNPVHTYRKSGEHTVKVWAINNYDNGKPPPGRPQKVVVKKITRVETTKQVPIPGGVSDALQLKNNCSPVPEQEMVVVMSYENQYNYATNGKLYLFYNERKYKSNNFELMEARTHNGEKEVTGDASMPLALLSATDGYTLYASRFPVFMDSIPKKTDPMISTNKALEESRAYYKNLKVFEFNDMPSYQTRNVFFSFRTTPEMLKDTSALITIRGIYVPERGTDDYKSKALEMEIVTSHDPNKMSVSDTRLNYRFYKKKDMHFKIRFQNNGEGPARSIKLLVDVPQAYDMRSLKVEEMYPSCPICPEEPVSYSCLDTLYTSKQLIFHFKNIYLPGSNQKNVSERDSTKGFVRYTLKYKQKAEKEKSMSRTAIIFDKNEPVITNYASTRFKPGLSIGAMVASGHFTARSDYKNYVVGATFSPYKAARGYFQSEFHLGSLAYADSSFNQITQPLPGAIDVVNLTEISQEDAYNKFMAYVVPVSYRYSVSKWLGLGAGAQLNVTVTEKRKTATYSQNYIYFLKQNLRERNVALDKTTYSEEQFNLSDLSGAVFADVVLGSARIGPALGARYLYHSNAPRQQWQFYFVWKF